VFLFRIVILTALTRETGADLYMEGMQQLYFVWLQKENTRKENEHKGK